MTLNEAILIIIKEVNIQKKEKLGDGVYKNVFPLKSKPDYVVKQVIVPKHFEGSKKEYAQLVFQKEVDFARKYPTLFAKIIKVDYEKAYMIQEKLNTEKFLAILRKLVNEAQQYEHQGSGVGDFEFITIIIEYRKNILNELYEGENIDFLNKLMVFIKSIRNIEANTEQSESWDFIDLHGENIGFDKSGNIKLLDI